MTIRKKPNYLLIGIFMAIGFTGILTSVIFADKLINKFKGGYPIYIRFNNLDGLVPGSKIIVGSGKNIGQIDSIELDGATLVVKAFIENKYKINTNARFAIFSTSFVGGKYISVEDFTGLAPYIEPKTTIQGIDPVTINSILGMFTDTFASGTEEGVATGISGIIASINDTVSTFNHVLHTNQSNINTTIQYITKISKHVDSIVANVDRKLLSVSDQEFQKIITDAGNSLRKIDTLLKDIDSPNAPLSLLKDPNMTHSIRTIVTNLEETTKRVKAKPSLLLRS